MSLSSEEGEGRGRRGGGGTNSSEAGERGEGGEQEVGEEGKEGKWLSVELKDVGQQVGQGADCSSQRAADNSPEPHHLHGQLKLGCL